VRKLSYSIYGNQATFLHAHLFPRYEWEPEYHRKNPVWTYLESNWTEEKYQWNEEKHKELFNRLSDKLSKLMKKAYE